MLFEIVLHWCVILYFCRLDLLPFYARLVGTLHPCMSDVAEDLCSMLKGDFRFHVCFHWFSIDSSCPHFKMSGTITGKLTAQGQCCNRILFYFILFTFHKLECKILWRNLKSLTLHVFANRLISKSLTWKDLFENTDFFQRIPGV